MAALSHEQAMWQDVRAADQYRQTAIGWKRYYAAAPLLLVMIALHFASGRASLYFGEVWQFPDDSPGDAPPWYFIRRDLIQGVCHATGLALTLIVLLPCLLYRPRWPRSMWAGMALWMAVLSHSVSIWQAVLIYFRTSHPMTPKIATSDWATFHEYNSDWLRSTGTVGCLLASLCLAVFVSRWSRDMLLREVRCDHPRTP